MVSRSSLRPALRALSVCGGCGSMGVVPPRASRSRVNRSSFPQPPQRVTGWRSHNSRGTPISIASTAGSRSRRSLRPHRLKLTRTSLRMVAALRLRRGRSGHVQIWVAAADGSNARQLTHNTRQWPGSPSWSPDGGSIAFDSNEVGAPVHIWIIDADGGTARQLTNGPGNHSVPRWSHDGKWIYFSSDRATTRNIWRVPSTGGEPQQITRTAAVSWAMSMARATSFLYQPSTETPP